MARYKETHRGATHEAIIEAASKLLRDHGFTQTSVVNVMKAVGLTHGGFYAHFPDKTAMLVAAIEAAFVESPQNFAFLANAANAKGDAGFIAEKYLGDDRVENIATGCPAAALASEIHRQPDAVRAAFQCGATATARELAGAPGLSAMREEGAWAALAMLMGALSLMRATTDAELRQVIRGQVVEALRRLGGAVGLGRDDH